MCKKIRNVEDAIMKSIMDVFKEDALKFFGIKSKIVTSARTELKNLEINTAFMDYTFLLDNNSFIHFEFQTTDKKEDLSRFLAYDASLHYKENKPVNTIVVYSSNIKKAVTSIDIGSIKYSIKAFYMNSIALLYSFAEKFVNDENMNKIKEVFRMTELGKLLKQEGIEEGRKEGRKEELIRTSIKLLTKKFAILPDDVKIKIENSDVTVLEIIVDGILDFEKLDDILKYLK